MSKVDQIMYFVLAGVCIVGLPFTIYNMIRYINDGDVISSVAMSVIAGIQIAVGLNNLVVAISGD